MTFSGFIGLCGVSILWYCGTGNFWIKNWQDLDLIYYQSNKVVSSFLR